MEDGSLDALGLPVGTSCCTLLVLPTWVPRPRWGVALQGSFWIPACAGMARGGWFGYPGRRASLSPTRATTQAQPRGRTA